MVWKGHGIRDLAAETYLAGASVREALSSLVQRAEIAVLHVLCVTHRISELLTGELSVHTLILATAKCIKGRQANLWFWHTSEKR